MEWVRDWLKFCRGCVRCVGSGPAFGFRCLRLVWRNFHSPNPNLALPMLCATAHDRATALRPRNLYPTFAKALRLPRNLHLAKRRLYLAKSEDGSRRECLKLTGLTFDRNRPQRVPLFMSIPPQAHALFSCVLLLLLSSVRELAFNTTGLLI